MPVAKEMCNIVSIKKSKSKVLKGLYRVNSRYITEKKWFDANVKAGKEPKTTLSIPANHLPPSKPVLCIIFSNFIPYTILTTYRCY